MDTAFGALVARMSVGVVVLRGDPADPDRPTIAYVNEAAVRLTGGGEAHDLTGRPIADLLGVDVSREIVARVLRTGDRPPHNSQLVLATGDARSPVTRTIAVRGRVLEPMGEPDLDEGLDPDRRPDGQDLQQGQDVVLLELIDVTRWVEAETMLRTSEETFRLSFDGALASMAWTGLEPRDPGRVVRVNTSLCRLLGYDQAELLSRTFPELVHEEEAAESRGIIDAMVAGWLTSWRGERRLRHADGHDVWTLLSCAVIQGPQGAPLYCVSQVEDITARKEAEARLTHLALHDALTGLPNRHLLQDHVGQALARARRTRSRVGVLFVDIDDFKSVNDSMGHTAGDEMLVQVGQLLLSALRECDTAARIGGDEFILVCEDLVHPDEIRPIAERILALFDRELTIRGHQVSVSVSIGAAVSAPDTTAEDLLREADAAMHRGKRRGRGHWEPADRTLQASAARRIQLEAGLRHAITAGELVIHYQPIVELETGRLTGVEALLRWQHPARGLLLPGEFLDVAEERLLIVTMGAWVLRQACAQAAHWHRRFGDQAPTVGVNISARQVGRGDLLRRVREALQTSGLAAEGLHLEITERQVIDLLGTNTAELRSVTDLGVGLSIDDFGTGYAGFTYLRALPINTLKIDQSFVAGLGQNHTATAITGSLAALGRTLDLTVIAEGVETVRQRDLLIEFGCPLGQGRLWRMAVPPQQIDDMLERPELLTAPGEEDVT